VPQTALRTALLYRRIDRPAKSAARAGAQRRCRLAKAVKQHMLLHQCTWCGSCTPSVSTPQRFWQNNRHAQFDGSRESCRPVCASAHPADDARDDAKSAGRRWPVEYSLASPVASLVDVVNAGLVAARAQLQCCIAHSTISACLAAQAGNAIEPVSKLSLSTAKVWMVMSSSSMPPTCGVAKAKTTTSCTPW